jgi:hypothetical protein
MLRFLLFSLAWICVLGNDNVWGPANFTSIDSNLIRIGNNSDYYTTPPPFQNDSLYLEGHYTLGEFISSIFTSSNTSWTFVSVITVYPPVCNALDKIISEFNNALEDANPEADDIRTFPRQLGSTTCSRSSGCPCAEGRRDLYKTRSLELETRSRTKRLNIPQRLMNYPWFFVDQS